MIMLFWNVQRLGSGTPEKRMEIFEGVLAEVFSSLYKGELAVLCEVVSKAVVSKHANVTISKQAEIRKRGQGKQTAQLGYAAIDDDMEDVELEKFIVPKFKEVFGIPVPKKGGNDFGKQSKRSVAYIGEEGGRKLYVYHANASAKASFLVAWVAETLRQETGGKFVLMGDLNAPPDAVKTSLTAFGADQANFVFASDGHTHNAKSGVTQTYDYAITGKGQLLQVSKIDIRPVVRAVAVANLQATASATAAAPSNADIDEETNANMSDHMPIIVEF